MLWATQLNSLDLSTSSVDYPLGEVVAIPCRDPKSVSSTESELLMALRFCDTSVLLIAIPANSGDGEEGVLPAISSCARLAPNNNCKYIPAPRDPKQEGLSFICLLVDVFIPIIY